MSGGVAALEQLVAARERHEFLTGLFFIDESRKTLPQVMNLTDTALSALPEERLRPTREAFARAMADFD